MVLLKSTVIIRPASWSSPLLLLVLLLVLLLISSSRFSSSAVVEAFLIPKNTSTRIQHPSSAIITTTTTTTATTTTQLQWGVIVPVPDDFFTITGISLGFAYTILRSWNRVTLENVAWENRLQDARLAKLDQDMDNEEDVDVDEEKKKVFRRSTFIRTSTVNNIYTELDLRKMDADASLSAYGPEAMNRRRKDAADDNSGRRRGGDRRRNRVMTLDNNEDDEYDYEIRTKEEEEDMEDPREKSDRVYSMTDEQIQDFEEKYGIEYDPYYDEPYTEDELPDDMTFVQDKVYGDRRYENGEIFYRDENNKNLYWRQGGRPRLKQFWELL